MEFCTHRSNENADCSSPELKKFDYLALHQIVGNISFLAFDISGGRIGIRPIPCSQVIFDDRQIGDVS